VPFKLPKNDHRLVIVGRTGTGKTQAAAWQLVMRNIGHFIWIIFDFKGDHLLNQLGAVEITLTQMPKKPGLYIVHPLPHQNEQVETMLWEIWRRGNIGVFIDEGYMIGDSAAFRAMLTQGRSKRIPMIILSQRPVWLSRFVFSEADYYQVFRLNDRDDRKTMSRFIAADLETKLPDYHSVYFTVANEDTTILAPAPDQEIIIETAEIKLAGTKERLRLI